MGIESGNNGERPTAEGKGEQSPEMITTAVVRYVAKNGDLYERPGPNHLTITNELKTELPEEAKRIDDRVSKGFQTTHQPFVDRKEAYTIAQLNGQLKAGSPEGKLYSDNVIYAKEE